MDGDRAVGGVSGGEWQIVIGWWAGEWWWVVDGDRVVGGGW